MSVPPSTAKVAPVIQEAAFEDKNKHVPPIRFFNKTLKLINEGHFLVYE